MTRRLPDPETYPIVGSPWCAIDLPNGYIALIDAADLPLIDGHSICHDRREQGEGYVLVTKRGSRAVRRRTRLHNLVLPVDMVDHINGDGLDCRRVNLRPTTPSLNGANRATQKRSSSGFKGVSPTPEGRWRARIGAQNKHIGNFTSPEDAARAYDAAALAKWGAHARLNFPRNGANP